MAWTTVDIDDDACCAVMQRFGLRTEQEAVNDALRRLAVRLSAQEARQLRGSGWDGDLGELRGL